jgi:hypothetical protein
MTAYGLQKLAEAAVDKVEKGFASIEQHIVDTGKKDVLAAKLFIQSEIERIKDAYIRLLTDTPLPAPTDKLDTLDMPKPPEQPPA